MKSTSPPTKAHRTARFIHLITAPTTRPGLVQRSYESALRNSRNYDLKAIDAAIAQRWGQQTLEQIRARAWSRIAMDKLW